MNIKNKKEISVHLSRSAGVTLLELLVSLAIAAIIFAGVAQLYQTSVNNSISFEGASRIQENARYVFNRLETDISQAGSSGCMNTEFANAFDGGGERVINLLSDEVNTHARFDQNHALSGSDNTGPNESDTLTLRYANRAGRITIEEWNGIEAPTTMEVDEDDPNYSDLRQYDTVFATNCVALVVFMITNDVETSGGTVELLAGVPSPAGEQNAGQSNITQPIPIRVSAGGADALGAGPGNLFAYLFRGGSSATFYEIGDSAAGPCNEGNPQNCALLRNGLPIVEGVQDFQVEYGRENGDELVFTPWGPEFLDLDPDDLTIARNVDRVRVTITFNSIDSAPTFDGDQFLSRQVVRTFNLRNQTSFR